MTSRLRWILFMLMAGLLMAGCSRPASPTPTSTRTPAPKITPTLRPTSTPATSPVPTASAPLVVADFDACTGANNLGGPMGAAYNSPDSLKESYQVEANRGCVARLQYQITGWAGFWMKLQGADLRPYSRLVFDVRADPQPGIPGQMKLELKRANEVSIKYVSGLSADWQTISVKLSEFGYAGYGKPVSSWQGIDELVVVFEAARSGRSGVVYLDNILFAADGPLPTRRPTNTVTPTRRLTDAVTPTPTPSPSARASEIIVDDFSPQPYQGQPVYFFNRLDGDRGAINNSAMTWGRGQVTTTIAAGQVWGGGWLSLNHPMREELPINFSAVLPAQVLPPYQSQIAGITARITASTPGRVFRLEFKDHGKFRWTREIILNGGEQVLTSDLPALGEINELVWVLDRATSGDFVVLDSIAVTTTTQITDTATAAFVWSYGQLLNNWNPVTGLARDKAKDASGEFDAVQATGSLAAATAMAEQLGVIARADAIQVVNTISNTLLTSLPRHHGLWPHWTSRSATGAPTIVWGAEWSSVDTVIAAIGLLSAQQALGLDTSGTEALLRGIEWGGLMTPRGISHGYTYDGALIPYAWDVYGGESWLVELAYAAATGRIAPMTYPSPPTANGSGFIDELAFLFAPPPSGKDVWGNDWQAYRSAAAAAQIAYFGARYPTSCFARIGLWGLSAAEGPDPAQVPPEKIYQAFGVGGRFAAPHDGSALWGAPVVAPHYSALIASLRPKEVTRVWDWLIGQGYFSPLTNVESLLFQPGTSCDPPAATWNSLKGSWNLALQALGWGRYLAQRRGQVPILWHATMENALLRQGYRLLAPGGPTLTLTLP